LSTSQENWEICKENSLWGMDNRYYVTLEKHLKAGDKAVFYTHGGYFVAAVEFEGKYYYDPTPIGWTKGNRPFLYPYRIKFRIIKESLNPPKISFSTESDDEKAKWTRQNLIDDITFIADKGRTWNQYLQVSIIRITEEDYDTISNAL